MQGRQTQSYTGNFAKGKAIRPGFVKNTGNVTANQPRIIQCYNCRAQAQEAGVAVDEEQLAFLVDTEERVNSGPHAQALATTDIFQTYDIYAFYLDCDEIPTTNAVFMENLSAYESDVLYEVPNHGTCHENNVIDQSVQEMQYSEQPVFVNDSDIDITSDNNVISYDQYLKVKLFKILLLLNNKML
ncbi:hypothetical protein Tco_1005959 [Tanacetum coccineum]|uniref:Uncharacterized protein n=1 Tax=Tanacetum coccineum TaxID=301880 RepID=A0ABQ5FGJ9_9ASTR